MNVAETTKNFLYNIKKQKKKAEKNRSLSFAVFITELLNVCYIYVFPIDL